MVTIPVEEHERLQYADKFLSALQAAGVDNWQGYDQAIDIMNEGEEND